MGTNKILRLLEILVIKNLNYVAAQANQSCLFKSISGNVMTFFTIKTLA